MNNNAKYPGNMDKIGMNMGPGLNDPFDSLRNEFVVDGPLFDILKKYSRFRNVDTVNNNIKVLVESAQRDGVRIYPNVEGIMDFETWSRSHLLRDLDENIQGISANRLSLDNLLDTGVLSLLLLDRFPPALIPHINNLFAGDLAPDDWFREFARDTYIFVDDDDGSVSTSYQLQKYKDIILDYIKESKSYACYGLLLSLRETLSQDQFIDSDNINELLGQVQKYLDEMDFPLNLELLNETDWGGCDVMLVGNYVYNPPAIN